MVLAVKGHKKRKRLLYLICAFCAFLRVLDA